MPAAYVDGRSVTLTTFVDDTIATNFQVASPLNFMSRNGASLFGAGQLCDVRIYATLLSTAEAWALYDPRTRWDLYQEPERRAVWAIGTSAPTGPFPGGLTLLGVGR